MKKTARYICALLALCMLFAACACRYTGNVVTITPPSSVQQGQQAHRGGERGDIGGDAEEPADQHDYDAERGHYAAERKRTRGSPHLLIRPPLPYFREKLPVRIIPSARRYVKAFRAKS